MQLHQLKPTHKSKRPKRIARGGKRGTTAGRGTKGQKSRAGHRIRPEIRDLIMKFPKSRGEGKAGRFTSLKTKPVVVNLDLLEEKLETGVLVTPKLLVEKGLIARSKGKIPEVKILGQGTISKKVDFKGVLVSKTAREKIIASGGTIQ